jgi:hypothetical protein
MQKLREEEIVVMAEADNCTVFIVHATHDTELSPRWMANSLDFESGYRHTAFTSESLVEKWLTQALEQRKVHELELDQAPIEGVTFESDRELLTDGGESVSRTDHSVYDPYRNIARTTRSLRQLAEPMFRGHGNSVDDYLEVDDA